LRSTTPGTKKIGAVLKQYRKVIIQAAGKADERLGSEKISQQLPDAL